MTTDQHLKRFDGPLTKFSLQPRVFRGLCVLAAGVMPGWNHAGCHLNIMMRAIFLKITSGLTASKMRPAPKDCSPDISSRKFVVAVRPV